jgi:hypothetical protein
MRWTPICANKHKNVNKTTGGKDEPSIVLCGNRNGHRNTERARNVKTHNRTA